MDQPLKQWLTGRKREENGSTKLWISGKKKKSFLDEIKKTFFTVFEGLSFGQKQKFDKR